MVGLQTPVVGLLCGLANPVATYSSNNTSIYSTTQTSYNCKPLSITSFLAMVINTIIDPNNIFSLLGISFLAGVVVLLSGFSAMFIIPAVLALLVANMLFIPINVFLVPVNCAVAANGSVDQACVAASGAVPFGTLIILIYNVMLVLTLIGFVRGQN